MTFTIRTDLGPEAARKIAKFDAGREVYIAVVYKVAEDPEVLDYQFTTNGKICERTPDPVDRG
jgi:hypothetical protein